MTKIYNDLSKFFFSLQISVLIFLIPTNSLWKQILGEEFQNQNSGPFLKSKKDVSAFFLETKKNILINSKLVVE